MTSVPKQKCHFYHNAGYCSAGANCRFAHEDTVRINMHWLAARPLLCSRLMLLFPLLLRSPAKRFRSNWDL